MGCVWATFVLLTSIYLSIYLSKAVKFYLSIYQPVGRVINNCPGDRGSIPGWVISKTPKMVLDTSLLNTQHYKVCIKGKVEQSRERSSAPLHLGVVATEKGAFGLPSTTVANFTYTSVSIYLSHQRFSTHENSDNDDDFSIRCQCCCYYVELDQK